MTLSEKEARVSVVLLKPVRFCEPMSPRLLKTKTHGRVGCCGLRARAGLFSPAPQSGWVPVLPPEGAPLNTGTKGKARRALLLEKPARCKRPPHPHTTLSAGNSERRTLFLGTSHQLLQGPERGLKHKEQGKQACPQDSLHQVNNGKREVRASFFRQRRLRVHWEHQKRRVRGVSQAGVLKTPFGQPEGEQPLRGERCPSCCQPAPPPRLRHLEGGAAAGDLSRPPNRQRASHLSQRPGS